ncbi:MAG: acyltransferase [Comamonadaceae bacterium]|nr:MAG: acyltransferase [Comamonadaceae bacterium]
MPHRHRGRYIRCLLPKYSNPMNTSSPAQLSGAAPKLLGLELLRFVAAMAVIVFHFHTFSYVGDVLPNGFIWTDQPFYSGLAWFYDFGRFGVQVFWGISGYIFFWKYGEKIASKSVGGWAFFVLRFSRLYPLHVATLVLVALLQALYFGQTGHYLQYQHNDAKHFVVHLFMASGWSVWSYASFNGPIWSVSVELLIYGMFFGLLRLVGSSLSVNIVVVAFGFACVALKVSTFIFECMLFFYLGGLVATAQPRLERYKRLVTTVSLTVVALSCLGAALSTRLPLLPVPKAVFAVLVPAVLFLATWHFSVPRSWERWIVMLGNMSYSSYLIHFPIQVAIAFGFAAAGRAIPVQSGVFFVLFFASVLIVAPLLYRWFELPCQTAIRRRLLGNARPRAPELQPTVY